MSLRTFAPSARGADDGRLAGVEDALQQGETRHGRIAEGDAVFFHVGRDRLWNQHLAAFLRDWPGLSGEAAASVERGARLVGSDCLSIDRSGSLDVPAHLAPLGAGILVGEKFARLGELPPFCLLAALPIVDGSGSPLRAIASVPRREGA